MGLSGLLKPSSRTFWNSPCPVGATPMLCDQTLRLSGSPGQPSSSTSHCTPEPSQGPGEMENTLVSGELAELHLPIAYTLPPVHQANAVWVGAPWTDTKRGSHFCLRLSTLNTITFPPPHLCLGCTSHLEFPSVSLLLLISNLIFKAQMPLPPCSLPRLPQLP